MAIGPVMIWPSQGSRLASMTAFSAGGMTKPLPSGGITLGRPEMHSTSTVSPGAMVSTGGKLALKTPMRVVSGVARRVWAVMARRSPGRDAR